MLLVTATATTAARAQATTPTPSTRADVVEPRAEAAPAPTPAQSGGRSSALVDLEDEVMCIVCERPLATSAGDAAEEERSIIQGYLDQGLTKDQVKDRLVAEYGEKVLVTGTTPITAAEPIVAGLIGATSVVLLLRRRRKQRTPESGAPRDDALDDPGPADDRNGRVPLATSPADDARIDAELAERD